MARAWVHDRMKNADYPEKVAAAKKAKRLPPMRWQVRWYDPSGKLQTELWRKEKEATDRRDEIAQQLAQGTYRDPKAAREKIRVVAESWFKGKSPRWEPKTRRLYREVLDGYIYPKWGATAVGAIGYEPFAVWLSSLHGKPGLTGSAKRTVGASRIQTIYQVMRSIMTWAVKGQRIPSNPISALDTLPDIPRPKRLYLTHEQVASLGVAVASLETASGRPLARRERYALAVDVMAYCGPRIGELVAIRKAAFDLDFVNAEGEWEPRLHIVEAVSEDDDGKPVIGLPKGGRIRVTGVPAFLVPMLRPVLDELEEDELVFPGQSGELLNTHSFRTRVFNPAVAKAGLPEATTPHTLRHSFASLSVAAGADVKTLQATMGHATAAITLDVYSDLFPPRVGQVSTALGRARDLALAA